MIFYIDGQYWKGDRTMYINNQWQPTQQVTDIFLAVPSSLTSEMIRIRNLYRFMYRQHVYHLEKRRGDCLMKWLIMLGFMDLRGPRVCRRSTPVLFFLWCAMNLYLYLIGILGWVIPLCRWTGILAFIWSRVGMVRKLRPRRGFSNLSPHDCWRSYGERLSGSTFPPAWMSASGDDSVIVWENEMCYFCIGHSYIYIYISVERETSHEIISLPTANFWGLVAVRWVSRTYPVFFLEII